MKFSDKTALITGAARGIGAAYAMALADRGAAVVLGDIDFGKVTKLADDIKANGGRALAVHLDVGDAGSCRACVDIVLARFGKLDHLINNAGMVSSAMAPNLLDIAMDQYHRTLEVNMHSVLYMTRAALPAFQANGGGSIVNTSSIAAWLAAGVYSLSKLGVNGLTINLARALAPYNVRMNAIAAGTTNTEGMQPLMSVEQMSQWGLSLGRPTNRVAEPQDIVQVGLFLLSDEASYINGQILAVDGGIAIRA